METIHGAVAKCKVRSTRLMVIAVFGFVFCWAPKFFVDLLNVYGLYGESNFALKIWCFLAQMSSSSVNPAIYAFFSSEFRKNFIKFCCSCCSRSVISHRPRPRQCGENRVQPEYAPGVTYRVNGQAAIRNKLMSRKISWKKKESTVV
ncbi:G-protein coupled receptor 1 [Desmophyllum pertusum]|uniref:G-protein coupled receptor 1 n=1 Tax=Desmophyllum pertusum TaxID=174260 RepID=A0A9X0CTN8_9CNID|nr:G-protein coupled receptor 1 [Desmophyllum pertusum]